MLDKAKQPVLRMMEWPWVQAQDVNLVLTSPPGTGAAMTQQLVNAVTSGDVARNLQGAGYGVNTASITSINGQPYDPSGMQIDTLINKYLRR